MIKRKVCVLSNNGLAKMHINKASGREFGLMIGEGRCECPLVMIKAIFGRVVFSSNIDHSVASLEQGRISGSYEGGRGIVGQKSEHIDGQGFIGVKMAIVSANDEGISLYSLCSCFGHSGESAKHKLGEAKGWLNRGSKDVCWWRRSFMKWSAFKKVWTRAAAKTRGVGLEYHCSAIGSNLERDPGRHDPVMDCDCSD